MRASKKLRGEELLITGFAATRLRMELDRVPLWRGDHVEIQQLVEHFARYLYLPRLQSSEVLLGAIRDGLAMVTWEQDSFAHAESYDEEAGRYRGLQFARQVRIADASAPGLLVKPEVARSQIDTETTKGPTTPPEPPPEPGTDPPERPQAKAPTRFHGTVDLDVARVGRDAGRIAEEVISHLAGLVGAKVEITLEIDAEIPAGAPENVVRTVTENSRTLKFTNQGFETD